MVLPKWRHTISAVVKRRMYIFLCQKCYPMQYQISFLVWKISLGESCFFPKSGAKSMPMWRIWWWSFLHFFCFVSYVSYLLLLSFSLFCSCPRTIFVAFKERWERGRKREKHWFVVPLIDAFIGWVLHVPWLRIEPATFWLWDDAPTNWPGPLGSFWWDFISLWMLSYLTTQGLKFPLVPSCMPCTTISPRSQWFIVNT